MVYLEITLQIAAANRPAAAGVYERCKAPFLKTIAGATPDVRIYQAAA